MKNNQLTSVRSPEFATPPSIRRCITSTKPCTLSTCESQSNSQSHEAKRKRQERDEESEKQRRERLDRDQQRKRNAKESESENQRRARLDRDQQRKRNAKESESENQRRARLDRDQQRKRNAKESESENQRRARLDRDQQRKRNARERESENERQARLERDQQSKLSARQSEDEKERQERLDRDQQWKRNARESESENERTGRLSEQQERSKNNRSDRNTQGKRSFQVQTRQSSAMTKSADREERRTKRAHSMNEQLISETKRRTLLNEYVWPAVIPMQLKERCLEDISNDMSMSVLRQSTCVICDTRSSANIMKKLTLQDIPSQEKLICPADIVDTISRNQQTTGGETAKCNFTYARFCVLLADAFTNSSFLAWSNKIFYRKEYNELTKAANLCQQCYSALTKDKIPIFSAANKMWVGDVPLVLQQLTIAEEKL